MSDLKATRASGRTRCRGSERGVAITDMRDIAMRMSDYIGISHTSTITIAWYKPGNREKKT